MDVRIDFFVVAHALLPREAKVRDLLYTRNKILTGSFAEDPWNRRWVFPLPCLQAKED